MFLAASALRRKEGAGNDVGLADGLANGSVSMVSGAVGAYGGAMRYDPEDERVLSFDELLVVLATAVDGLTEAIGALPEYDVMQPCLEEAVDLLQIRLHLLTAGAGA